MNAYMDARRKMSLLEYRRLTESDWGKFLEELKLEEAKREYEIFVEEMYQRARKERRERFKEILTNWPD